MNTNAGFMNVKIEYPLKQGLKLLFLLLDFWFCSSVKIEYPLKQGLKLDLKKAYSGNENGLK